MIFLIIFKYKQADVFTTDKLLPVLLLLAIIAGVTVTGAKLIISIMKWMKIRFRINHRVKDTGNNLTPVSMTPETLPINTKL
jgi:hypothetical protein